MAQLPPSTVPRYHFGFVAASLRPELARIVAEIYIKEGSWADAKARVLASNALQCRTPSSAARMEREIRLRLSTLTPDQIARLTSAAAPDRAALSWLAAFKHSAFLFDFAADVLRDKVSSLDFVFRNSDYETFVDNKAAAHPEVAQLRESSRKKIRQVLMNMLVEAGLIVGNGKTTLVQRTPLSHAVRDQIVADDPNWLAGFLFTDAEIGELRCR